MDLKVGAAAVATEDRRDDPPIEIYFLPFVGGGHQIPMLDLARLFSSIPNVHATVLAASSLRPLPPLPASIAVLYLSDVDLDTSLSALPFTDTSHLAEPLRNLLVNRSPDCIVVDRFHRWSAALIDPLGVPRVAFSGNGCFSRAVGDVVRRAGVAEAASDDYEEFVVLGIRVKVGNREWTSWNTEAKEPVGREKIERAMRVLMSRDGREHGEEMRKRARELGRKAREAVEEDGGTSWEDARGLVEELRVRRRL